MTKLVVAGCSFSDRFNDQNAPSEHPIESSYGDLLAERLSFDYLHLADAGSSNDCIWRKVTNGVMTGEITPDDIVLIQYTEIYRKEFYYHDEITGHKNDKIANIRDGSVVKFKFGSYNWYQDIPIADFLKLYEENFVCHEYDMHKFELQNYMFQAMLALHNINAHFLILNVYGPEPHNIFKTEHFAMSMYINRQVGRQLPQAYSPTDNNHLSADGHKYLSEQLYLYLEEKNAI